MEKKFTSENFEAEVLKSEKPVLGRFLRRLVRTVQDDGSGC